MKTFLLQYSVDLDGSVVLRNKVINAFFDLATYLSYDLLSFDLRYNLRYNVMYKIGLRLRLQIGQVQDRVRVIVQDRAGFKQTPQAINFTVGYNDEEIDEMLNAKLFHRCMLEYNFFEMFNFFGGLTASSNKWSYDTFNWPKCRSIGFFLLDVLNKPDIPSKSPDMTVFDLLHAVNDAIETVENFGSFKKIIRSTLDFASIIVEHPDKWCSFEDELIHSGPCSGPECSFKTLQSDLVKNAFVSFIKVRT